MTESSNYIPGVCNINPAEIRKRRQIGIFGTIVAIIGVVTFALLHASWHYYLILFAPLFVAALGFLQANHKFCAGYASMGKQHADQADVQTINDENARRADLLKARILYLEAFLIAVPLTALCCLIPLLYS